MNTNANDRETDGTNEPINRKKRNSVVFDFSRAWIFSFLLWIFWIRNEF